jgi:pyruvate formate lyase activating enzyme
MDRRSFIKTAAGAGVVFGAGPVAPLERLYAFGDRVSLSHREARFYRKLADREIECQLCPRACRLGDKERGYCGVRENDGGAYYTLVYGKAVTANVDPIEKKPFFHFLPRSNAFSIATAGCNVNCKFCQNWQISQVRAEQADNMDLPPDGVAAAALRYDCPVIAYTYTEPVVFYEYMYDTSVAARRAGIKNCVVTGGHINPEPLAELVKVVDAVKIDLKGFTEEFYTDFVRGELRPVLEAIKLVGRSGVWLEIVYLVIPTLNDHPDDIRRMSRWLAAEVGPDVPLHFSRFQPMYLVKNLPPTPVSTLEKALGIAREEGLRYVYVGNLPGHPAESTYCPQCREQVVQRFGFEVRAVHLDKGNCRSCGHPIPGIWA